MENNIPTRLQIMADIKLFMRYGPHSGNVFEVREDMDFRCALHYRYDSWFNSDPLVGLLLELEMWYGIDFCLDDGRVRPELETVGGVVDYIENALGARAKYLLCHPKLKNGVQDRFFTGSGQVRCGRHERYDGVWKRRMCGYKIKECGECSVNNRSNGSFRKPEKSISFLTVEKRRDSQCRQCEHLCEIFTDFDNDGKIIAQIPFVFGFKSKNGGSVSVKALSAEDAIGQMHRQIADVCVHCKSKAK